MSARQRGRPRILVLGASGLIGRFLTDDLATRGFAVDGVARRFAPGQCGEADVERPLMSLDGAALAAMIEERGADVVVNCLGVLQDGPGSDTDAVHTSFVARLIEALRRVPRRVRLIQISIPGDERNDFTAFARTKRTGERLIAASGLPYAILRPGFVIAPAAYGGSALLRSLAALRLALPAKETTTPFQAVAVADIAATVAHLADHDPADDPVWELVAPARVTLGDVVDAFRRAYGTDGGHLTIPRLLLDLGARLGDLAGLLGWRPPVRSTALAEVRRGVQGDPAPWLAATAIVPITLAASIGRATVQEKWFARLFLLKSVVLSALVVFWILSGGIALTIASDAASAILASHGIPPDLVRPITVVSSLADIGVGCLIAVHRTCRSGLLAGILVSLGYMSGAAVLTPDLWVEPLGALVKTGPAIILMLVALATLDDR